MLALFLKSTSLCGRSPQQPSPAVSRSEAVSRSGAPALRAFSLRLLSLRSRLGAREGMPDACPEPKPDCSSHVGHVFEAERENANPFESSAKDRWAR